MPASQNQVFTPSGFQELFTLWNSLCARQDGSQTGLYAGGTGYLKGQSSLLPVLPENIISLEKIQELRKISRTERYIEIGSMVTISQIIHIGRIIPEPVRRCLEKIADPHVRNQATIGGNICCPTRRLDTCAPMIALDAQYELRTAQTARWISASRFSSLPGPPGIAPQELLSRIRIPLEPWNFTSYRKLKSPCSNEIGGGIIFTMRNQKDILSDIRVVYSGKAVLREKNSESMLSGKHLPLDRREIMTFMNNWEAYLSEPEVGEKAIFSGEGENFKPELTKAQILHFIYSTLMFISD